MSKKMGTMLMAAAFTMLTLTGGARAADMKYVCSAYVFNGNKLVPVIALGFTRAEAFTLLLQGAVKKGDPSNSGLGSVARNIPYVQSGENTVYATASNACSENL